MRDPLNLYKLIVLFMLDNVNFPLTRVQVFDFIMGKGYVTFFSLQQTINELIDAGLIDTESDHNATQLLITDKGRETLGFFQNRIPENIRDSIIEFLTDNDMDMRRSTSVSSDFFKTTTGEYEVTMEVKDKDNTLIALTINVPSRTVAEKMCNGWENKNSQIYEYLIKYLQEKDDGTV